MSGLARNGSSATPPSMWHVLHSMSISSWTVDSKTLRPVGPPSTGPPSVDPRPPAPPLPPPLPLVEPLKMPAPLLGWPDPDDAELLPHAPVATATTRRGEAARMQRATRRGVMGEVSLHRSSQPRARGFPS